MEALIKSQMQDYLHAAQVAKEKLEGAISTDPVSAVRWCEDQLITIMMGSIAERVLGADVLVSCLQRVMVGIARQLIGNALTANSSSQAYNCVETCEREASSRFYQRAELLLGAGVINKEE